MLEQPIRQLENLRESQVKDTDEREKLYYLRMKESHPDGNFVEDPRGRALEYDYEIEADTGEFPSEALETTYTTRMELMDKLCKESTIYACSKDILKPRRR